MEEPPKNIPENKTDEEKYYQIDGEPENQGSPKAMTPKERLTDIEAGIAKLAAEMKGFDPNGPDYRRAEEQWNMLRREQLALSAGSTPEPNASAPEIKNQYDAAFPARREAEEADKPAEKTSEPVSPAPVVELSSKPVQEEEERFPVVDSEGKRTGATITASEAKKKQEEFIAKWTPLKQEGLENQSKPQVAKERTIASPEEIANFVPVEQRVIELKESMVVGEHNKDTQDFLKMIAEPYERVGKMKEGKSKVWEKTKETWDKGKEWLKNPSWIKERLKGFATGGIWELWQGAKFQISARKTGKEMVKAHEKMQASRGVFTYDEAFAVHKKIAESGKLEPVDREKFEQYANTFRKEKNQAYIDLVTAQARAKIKERLNWGGGVFKGLEYRDRDGNKVQFDEAKLNKMMEDLRAKLVSMQDSAVATDIKDYTGIIKKDLDPKYWKHYQYAAVDALIWAKGYLLLNKYFAANAIPGKSLSAAPGTENIAQPSGIETGTPPPAGMDGTIWNTADQAMQSPPPDMGLEAIPNPNPQQLAEASELLAKGNGVGVDIWNIKGAPLDTMMQQGHPLNMNPLYENWDKIVKLGGK